LLDHTDKNRRHVDFVVSASKLDVIHGTVDGVDVNEWYLAGEVQESGLIQVKSCSLGCTLLKMEVLKKVRVRHNPRIRRADDSYFFHDCLEEGVQVLLDTSLLWQIDHVKRLGGEIPVGQKIEFLEEWKKNLQELNLSC